MAVRRTLTVVAESHLGLAKADSVLAGADAIESLKLRLLDILVVKGRVLASNCSLRRKITQKGFEGSDAGEQGEG